jgi:hypothetical protein
MPASIRRCSRQAQSSARRSVTSSVERLMASHSRAVSTTSESAVPTDKLVRGQDGELSVSVASVLAVA